MRVVINNWKNAEKIEKQYIKRVVNKKYIWHEKQNNPELIVEELMSKFSGKTILFDREKFLRNWFYSVLLRHGVNKWFFVRKLLIRLNKLYVIKINELLKEAHIEKEKRNFGKYHRLMGEQKAYNQVREDLNTLFNSPRWVIWNYKNPGMFSTIGMSRRYKEKFLNLFNKLWNMKFKK